MDDLEDVLEAFEEIEDIGEEIFEPDDLIEDFLEDPEEVIMAVVALVAGILTIVLLFLTLLFLLLTTGPLVILATFAGITFLATLLAVGSFLYFRTDVPRHIEKKVNHSLEKAEDKKKKNEVMTEQEAINQIKRQYSDGKLTEKELEEALDEVLKHKQKPKQVVKQYE